MAERAALFTWDDKSMNHLFQHCSAFAVCPRGTRFHLAHPPTLLVCPPAKKKKKEREESFRPKAKRLCAGVMIVLSLSLRRKLVFLYLFGWACALSSGSVFIQFNVHVWRVYLDIKVDLCVCACASTPQSPLLFPASFHKRTDSERAADVEALTFMVAKAQARVKRHAESPPSLPAPHFYPTLMHTPLKAAAAPCPPACAHTHSKAERS